MFKLLGMVIMKEEYLDRLEREIEELKTIASDLKSEKRRLLAHKHDLNAQLHKQRARNRAVRKLFGVK